MSDTSMNTPKPNIMTFDDLTAVATSLGADAGKGRDTQIKFLLKVTEGAYHNAIDLKPNKHGIDVDDCTKLAETYVKAQGSATVFDAKAMNQRKLISTLRTCTKLGQWPKGGNGEPLGTVNNLITMRQKLRQNPNEAKKLDDAANTLLKYARAQLKADQLIGDDALREFCYRKEAEANTAEDIIEECRNKLTKLIDGRASKGLAQDTHSKTVQARNALTDRLKEMATARGTKPNASAKV